MARITLSAKIPIQEAIQQLERAFNELHDRVQALEFLAEEIEKDINEIAMPPGNPIPKAHLEALAKAQRVAAGAKTCNCWSDYTGLPCSCGAL